MAGVAKNLPIRADYPKFMDKTRAKTDKTRALAANPYPNTDNPSSPDSDQRKRNPKLTKG